MKACFPLSVSETAVAMAINSDPMDMYMFYKSSGDGMAYSEDIIVTYDTSLSNTLCAMSCSHNPLCLSFVHTSSNCSLLKSWNLQLEDMESTLYQKDLNMTLSDIDRL